MQIYAKKSRHKYETEQVIGMGVGRKEVGEEVEELLFSKMFLSIKTVLKVGERELNSFLYHLCWM